MRPDVRSARAGVAAGGDDGSNIVVLKPGSEYVSGAIAQRVRDEDHGAMVYLPNIITVGIRRDRETQRVDAST